MAPRRKRTVEGSCWACKQRRVVCDLQHPACSRCTAGNQTCEYGRRLRWCNGVASRGRFAGQNIPDTSPRLLFASPTHIITTDQQVLYFEHEVLARFNLAAERLHVDLASISRDPALLGSVTAIANAHYLHYAKLSGKNAALEQTRARASAVEMFRKQLVSSARPNSPVSEIFTTNVLLCVLDGIIEPYDEGAATQCHFHGGRAILEQWRCLDQLFSIKKGMMALLLSVFATMDLTYALLSGQKPYFEQASWLNFSDSDAWWGNLDAEDPFLEILRILSQLALLGHQVHESGQALPIGDLLGLQMALERVDCRAQGLLRQDDGSSPVSVAGNSGDYQSSWYMFCSAYRITALIYMYRVLCNLEITHPLVREATAEGVHAICKTQFKGKLSSCLLFPTLIVGCHTLEPSSRKAVRESLMSTASYLSFGSTRIMSDFLENLWRSSEDGFNDFQWWECFQTLSRTTFLF